MNKLKLINKPIYIKYNTVLYYKNWKLSNNILYNKYSSFKYSYISVCITKIMFNEKCRIVSRFKDFLIYDDDTEFIKIYYKEDLLRNTLIKVYDFYDKYNKIFPNYIILPENVYMYKNLRKKQKMIDIKNNILMEKKNGVKKNLKKNENKKQNLFIFDEEAKENINRQNYSMVTISLTNTIISSNINNNENIKIENFLDINNSFVESNINNSSISISLYSKRSLFKENNNNTKTNKIKNFYNCTLGTESSLENIVNSLNNKKQNENQITNNNINNSKNKKMKFLNIDIISNNKDINYFENNNNNDIIMNNPRTHNFIIKTPSKNKIFKNYKRQLDQIKIKSLINERKIFGHEKCSSDIHRICALIKNSTERFTQEKLNKYKSKFPKEYNNINIIKKLTSSLLNNFRNRQRNKNRKISEEKYSEFNSKNKNEYLSKSNDINVNVKSKVSNNKECSINKEKNLIKVNNNYINKRIFNSKFSKNNNIKNYNKIFLIKKKKNDEEEEKNNRDYNKKRKDSVFLEGKLRFTLNCKNKGIKKENTKPTIDTDSAESTKISFNHRKTKCNFYINYDRINNNIKNNNQINVKINKDILQTQPKYENIFNNHIYGTSKNFNNIIKHKINKTDITIINNCTYGNNIFKNIKNSKVNIHNQKKTHKKHKTFSLQISNDNDSLFSFNNKRSIISYNKVNLNKKIKKIKDEILNSKKYFIETKEKYRKLSENNNNKKSSIFASTLYHKQKIDKITISSVLNNNNKRKDYNYKKIDNYISKTNNNELMSRYNNKTIKINNNIVFLNKKNYSIFNRTFKSPFAKKIIKEFIQDIQKSKEKIFFNSKYNKN